MVTVATENGCESLLDKCASAVNSQKEVILAQDEVIKKQDEALNIAENEVERSQKATKKAITGGIGVSSVLLLLLLL